MDWFMWYLLLLSNNGATANIYLKALLIINFNSIFWKLPHFTCNLLDTEVALGPPEQ